MNKLETFKKEIQKFCDQRNFDYVDEESNNEYAIWGINFNKNISFLAQIDEPDEELIEDFMKKLNEKQGD